MEIVIRVPEGIMRESKRALFNHAVLYRFRNIAGRLRDDWGITGCQLEAVVEWIQKDENQVTATLPQLQIAKGDYTAIAFFEQSTHDSLSEILDMCEVLFAEVVLKRAEMDSTVQYNATA